MATYFDSAIDERRARTVKTAVKFLKAKTKEFDAIAFSGMSGAVMAPILAYLLDKQLIIVRKDRGSEHPDQASHSSAAVEYAGSLRTRVVIVDDFIASGKTVKRIIEKIRDRQLRTEIVAVYCYHSGTSTYRKELLAEQGIKIQVWDTPDDNE